MQDIHAIGDAVGGGGGGCGARFIGGGDRRLRPQNHPNLQALKCPRCDSPNTKFCYYNNYNLSQPRHFCKSCRRYWTKGGVLRNVPVGGGCRKTKRSKAKTTSNSSAGDAPREIKSNAQSPSSESSSLTAATAAATATIPSSVVAEERPRPSNATSSNSTVLYNLSDASFSNVIPQANPIFDHQPSVNHPSTDGQMFSTEIGSFTSLMTSSEEMMAFGMGDIPTTSYAVKQPVDQAPLAQNPRAAVDDQFKMEDMSNEGLAAALDWGGDAGVGDQGLFDLTAGVDPAYWNQSEWTDSDQPLNYLP